MAVGAHLWITDEQGSPIRGHSKVAGREGSIEVQASSLRLYLSKTSYINRATGPRMHEPLAIRKQIDRTTPFLYRAVTDGSRLRTAQITFYRIDASGSEQEYFHMCMEDVRVVAVKTDIPNAKDQRMLHVNHREVVEFRYSKITWSYLDGNITFSDEWRG